MRSRCAISTSGSSTHGSNACALQALVGLPGIHNVTFENVSGENDVLCDVSGPARWIVSALAAVRAENGCLFSALDQLDTNPDALTGLVLRNVSVTIGRWPGTPNSTWAQLDYRRGRSCPYIRSAALRCSPLCVPPAPVRRPLDSDAPSPNTVPALVAGVTFINVRSALIDGGGVWFAGPAQPYWAGAGHAGVCSNVTGSSVETRGAPTCSPVGASG